MEIIDNTIDNLAEQCAEFIVRKEQLKNYRDYVFAFLAEKGYNPQIGEGNRIEFDHFGQFFAIDIDNTRVGCNVQMHLVYDASSISLESLKSAMNNVNKIKRVVKVFSEDSCFVVEASFFSIQTSDFDRLFAFFMGSLLQASREVSFFTLN